jgi:WD40 repeat protein
MDGNRSTTVANPKIVLALVLWLTGLARPGTAQGPDKVATRTDSHGDTLPPGALLRLGTLRHRYPDWRCRFQSLPDGKTLLCGSPQEVRWIDLADGRLRRCWPLPRGMTLCGFSSNGHRALLMKQRTLELWNLVTGKKLGSFQPKGDLGLYLDEVSFSADGKLMVSNSGVNYIPGLVRVWDVQTGKELWQEGVMGLEEMGLTALGFLPDEKTLVVLDKSNNRISLRERTSGRKQGSFDTMPRQEVRQCGLSPDGKTVLMGTTGTAVRVWDVASGKELPALGGHKEQARAFAIGRDGKVVLTGGDDSFLQVWDWPAGKLRRKIDLGAGARIHRLTVSADGKRAEIVCWGENALRFFDLKTGAELPAPSAAHRGPVYGLAVTPEGQILSGGLDNTLRLWDSHDGRQLRLIRTEHLFGATSLSLSADGRLIASADFNRNKVFLHELKSGRLKRELECGQRVCSVAFAPATRILAIDAEDVAEGSVHSRFVALFDAETGREVRRLKEAGGKPVFSPDGKLLATVSDEQVRLWEVATGRVYRTLSEENCSTIAFGPQGRRVACGDGRGITLWEVASSKKRRRITAVSDRAGALCFSANSRWLARNDGPSIQLFDVRTGLLIHTFGEHESSVTALAFGPGDRFLVSSCFDSTLLVWDVVSVTGRRRQPEAPLCAAALTTAWQDLASMDAEAAYLAIGQLVRTPAQSVSLLAERQGPVPALDRKGFDRLFARLDSDDFSEREQAERELEQQGEGAVPAVRRFLAGRPSL